MNEEKEIISNAAEIEIKLIRGAKSQIPYTVQLFCEPNILFVRAMEEQHVRKKSRFSSEEPSNGDSANKQSAQDRARQIAARLGSFMSRQDSAINSESAVTKKVYVPTRQYPDVNFTGLLIGPKGSTHRSLEEQSGTKIRFRGRGSAKEGEQDQDPDDDLHVLIVGDRDDKVKKAEDLVRAILFDENNFMDLKRRQLSDLGNSRITDPGLTVINKRVPKTHIGVIIGKGGETIRDLKDRSGAFIQVEDALDGDDAVGILEIRGRKECVEKADVLIQQILDDYEESSRQRGAGRTTYDVETRHEVDNDKVGLIIGKAGATIKSIQERCNTRVEVPKAADASNPAVRTLLIRSANKEDAEATKLEIDRICSGVSESNPDFNGGGNANPSGSEIFVVPNNKVGLIIGKSGATIKWIQSKTGCDIQVPPEADYGTNNMTRSIQLIGTPAQCNAARSEIEAILDDVDRGNAGNTNKQTQHGYYPYGAAAATGGGVMYGSDPYQMQWQQSYAPQPQVTTQKYTREQWRQWREYYVQFGYTMDEEPPPYLLQE